MMAWSQNHDMFKGFNKWHIYFGCIFVLYFLFCRFLKRGQMMISVCLLYCFLGSKIVLSFYLCKLFLFCQLPFEKNHVQIRLKRVFCLFRFFVQLKVREMMPTFLFRFFVSIFLIILEVVNWFLLDWRLQDYYGNFGKVSSRQGLQSYHKSFFFEWIIWWWSLRVFVCLMLTVGVAQPTRLPTPIKGGAFKVRVA